jgi:hypothetical protein
MGTPMEAVRTRVPAAAVLVVALAFTALTALTALTLGTTRPASGATSSRATDSTDGFSVVLPQGWNQVSLSSNDIGAIVGNAHKAAPGFNQSAISDAQTAAKQGLKFFAVSSASEYSGTFFPNMNVGVYPGSLSNALLDAQVKIQLAQTGVKNIKTKTVKFAGGSAIQGTYNIAATGGATLYGTQFYAPHAGNIYIVTFTDANRSQGAKSAAAAMASWRFTKRG